MMNETDFVTLEKYNYIAEQFTRYAGSVLYFFSLFGTINNMLTFSQRTYDRRVCSLYLLFASAFDFIHLSLDPLSNILQYGFSIDWPINFLTYCKVKSYFSYTATIISGMLTVFASATQYLLSSGKSRRWNYTRHHIGVRCITCTIVFWLIVSAPIAVCSKRFSEVFQHRRSVCSNPARYISCYAVQLVYICIFNGFLPPFIMMIFGLLTKINVHHLHRRSRTKSIRVRRINQQFAAMLILQSFKSTFASIPFSVFNCYWLATIRTNKSLLLQAKENLIHQIVYLLFWSNYTSFFIYIYSSDIFRDQWVTALKRLLSCCYEDRRRNLLSTN